MLSKNGCNTMFIEFFVIPFWSEIIGVNQTRAACSSQFRITRIIWDQIRSARFQVALLKLYQCIWKSRLLPIIPFSWGASSIFLASVTSFIAVLLWPSNMNKKKQIGYKKMGAWSLDYMSFKELCKFTQYDTEKHWRKCYWHFWGRVGANGLNSTEMKNRLQLSARLLANKFLDVA